MPRRTPLYRLFVAIYPPPALADEMSRLLHAHALPPNRPAPPSQLHMTLQFIGDRHERDLDAILESVTRSAAGIDPISLTPTSLISLPEVGRARLVALATDAPPALLEIQRRLAHRLADPKRRRRGHFTPHLTLCRFVEEEPIDPIDIPITLPPFNVSEVRLMRSVLLHDGAEHRVMAAIPLDS